MLYRKRRDKVPQYIINDDITNMEAEVIVNAANTELLGGHY